MSDRNFIVFHNDYEKNLFDYELSGQISDGMYENSSPDWRYWCSLETKVGNNIGRTTNCIGPVCKKDNYSFQGLYDIIGDRMEFILKLTSVNAPKRFLDYSYKYSGFPEYLGEYDPETHKLLKRGDYVLDYKIQLNDDEQELFNWLEEAYGEEKMYDKWNRTPRPLYKDVLKGIRQCMKTINNDFIEETKKEESKEDKREKLKKHLVRTIRSEGRIRVEANDGVHGRAFVSFPKDLRTTENLFYYVENGLRWNGKNYLATKKDGIRQATNEEIKLLMLK